MNGERAAAAIEGLIAPVLVAVTTDAAALDRAVPQCPGWTVGSVLGHLGRVFQSVTNIIDHRLQSQPARDASPRPSTGIELVEFFHEAARGVCRSLRSIDPDEPVYSWSGPASVARFYHRRMPHETTVHVADIAACLGLPWHYESDMAVDAVDEFYGVVAPFALTRWNGTAPPAPMMVRAGDAEVAWLVQARSAALDAAGGTILDVTRLEHDAARIDHEGDGPNATVNVSVTVTGTAAQLLLYVWNRKPSELTIVGDRELADQWAAIAP